MYFGSLAALKDVSLLVKRGERRGIVGPNGSGKTTLFNVISGLLGPSEGKVFFLGRDITRMRLDERANLGMGRTFQLNTLFNNLTVNENILLGLGKKGIGQHTFRLAGAAAMEKAARISRDFGLEEKKEVLVSQISYGEQRLLELGLAFSLEPKLLLLDEPAAGLSEAETERIVGVIGRIQSDVTVIVIEHDMNLLFKIVDRITVLHHGEVISDGEKDFVKADPRVREVYLGES